MTAALLHRVLALHHKPAAAIRFLLHATPCPDEIRSNLSVIEGAHRRFIAQRPGDIHPKLVRPDTSGWLVTQVWLRQI
jgi:hypothetical protein